MTIAIAEVVEADAPGPVEAARGRRCAGCAARSSA